MESSSVCWPWKHLRRTFPWKLYCFDGNLNRSLTEWVSFCRVASAPGRVGHVCSFSPALRFESPDFPGLRRASSLPKSVCSLLKKDKLSRCWRYEAGAHANHPSAKNKQDTRRMFTRRLYNFGLCEQLFSPSTWLHSQLPPPPCPPTKASSLRAHSPRQEIGRDQNNPQSHWTTRIFLNWDIRYFLVWNWPLVERSHEDQENAFLLVNAFFGNSSNRIISKNKNNQEQEVWWNSSHFFFLEKRSIQVITSQSYFSSSVFELQRVESGKLKRLCYG